MDNSERIAAQIELEKEITQDSIKRYRREFQENIDNLSNTKPGTKLLGFLIGKYSQAIQDYLDCYAKGKVVRRPIAAIKITELGDVDKVAFIAAKSIINSLQRQSLAQRVGKNIGRSIEQEFKMIQYQDHNKKYYQKVLKDLKARGAKEGWKYTAVQCSFKKKQDFHINSWTSTQIFQVGFILLELFVQSTGIVEIKKFFEKGRPHKYVLAVPETLKWIEEENKRLEVLDPFFLPMICPPKDWTGIYDGGYISPFIRNNKLVKNYDREYLKRLQKIPMPEVYQAINTLQRTSWRVNGYILNVVNTLWGKGISVAGLPERDDLPITAFPYPDLNKGDPRTEQQQAEIRIWKNEVVATHRKNIQTRSIRLLTAQILRLANRFSQYDKIWFPYQMDFRGRLYPIPALFHPQGSDLAKGLLLFTEGKPINNEAALNWLRIHGANVFGEDKVSYDDRIKFIKSKEEEIRRVAEDPINNMEWTEADKPFQYLAFCREYTNFLEYGFGYVSSLPIQLDGTCNGLQNYSALLRDEIAGGAVNLIDAEIPQDIYAIVAEKLEDKLNHKRKPDHPDRVIATQWLDLGINRKLTKRPVMVLPYGGTKMSCRKYIEEYLTDNYSLTYIHEHFNYIGNEPTDTLFKVTQWLSNYLWDSITETVKSAIDAMAYIRKLSSIVNSREQPLEWVTPCGLLVRQAYKDVKEHRVETELYGHITQWRCVESGLKIDKQRQNNGICPNFIHSMDAATLMKYLNKMTKAGVSSFGAVHDSFWTLAADTELSAKYLRLAFVEIYEEDVLEKFKDDLFTDIEITDKEVERLKEYLPSKGTLDLREVLKSKYFFS